MSRVYALILSFGAAIVALDQWTKSLILETFAREGESKPFLSWWSFTLVHNPGAAFGMFRHLPDSYRLTFFILLPPVVLLILWWSYVRRFKATETLGPVAMGLVLGGALGNLIDRLRFEYVIDFIDWNFPWSSPSCPPLFYHFSAARCHWPQFNVADSAISVAMCLLVIYSLRKDKHNSKARPAAVH